MYRIMLADDEEIMLEALKTLLHQISEMNVKLPQQRQAEQWWSWQKASGRILPLWIFRCRVSMGSRL